MTRIAFDLDGTLIDSAPDIRTAANQMLAAEGCAPLDLATITSFVGNGLPHLVGLVMAERGLDPARHGELTGAVLAHYDAVNGELTRPYPGVLEALRVLQASGTTMALCTNKPEQPARDILRIMGLDAFFDQVVGGDSLPSRKPDAAPLLACRADLYVGDSEVDAATARAADVPFVLFTEGYRKSPIEALAHRARFDTFSDLPGLIARLEIPA